MLCGLLAQTTQRSGTELGVGGPSVMALAEIGDVVFYPGEIATMSLVNRLFYTFVIDHPEATMSSVGVEFIVE